MAYVVPNVYYSATLTGTYKQLTGIQSIQLSRGRQRMQDPYTANQMTIELIPEASYSPALAVGQYIDVRKSNSALLTECYFAGRITDIQRIYGMPYNSGTGSAPADRYIITAAGALGQLAANTVTGVSWADGIGAQAAAATIATQCGVSTSIATDNTKVSAQTYTGAALEAMNELGVTGQFGMADADTLRNASVAQLIFYNFSYGAGSPSVDFTDAGPTTVNSFKYKEIEYLSGVQSTFTQVQITPAGIAAQTASSGSAPYNTLFQNSFNQTAADGLNLATYLVSLNNETLPTPFKITTDSTLDTVGGQPVQNLVLLDGYYGGINALFRVTFRGQNVLAIAQGFSATFYPDYVTVTYYFSPSLGSPFILDSAYFGVLDTNRLGYP